MKELSRRGTRFGRQARRTSAGRRLLVVALLMLGVGVGLAFGWPWSIDMVWQPILTPFEEGMSAPPPGTLPTQGGELPTRDPDLRNPLPATPASLEEGKRLFSTYCAVCHGETGTGKGPVGSKFLVPPFDLTVERPEDYIYTRIRDGGVMMPSYKEALSVEEAWAVVNYVRSLQGK
ncbi:MAG: c-type cytochrome [Terriglobia bacterium]